MTAFDQVPVPPIAPKKNHITTLHGVERVDPFHWLRDKNWQQIVEGDLSFDDPTVLDYIEAENSYCDTVMASQRILEQTLYQDLLSRIREDDRSWPVKKGEYFYYSRVEKGKDYPIYCRKFQTMEAAEEIYFDGNLEAADRALFITGPSCTNRAQTLFAYSFNLTGSMEKTLRVRDLATGQDFDWEFPNSTGSFLWVDDKCLYIVERDDSGRGRDVYRINVYDGPEKKQRVYSKPEQYDAMFMSLSMTTDRQYVLLNLDSGASHTLLVSPTGSDRFEYFASGEEDISFSLDHHESEFFILTNRGADDFHVLRCPAQKQYWGDAHWQPVVAEQPGVCLNAIHIYSHYLVVERKSNACALDNLAIIDLNSGETRQVLPSEAAYCLDFCGDWDHNALVVRVDCDTPVNPHQVFELDLASAQLREVYRKPVPNFDPDLYQVRRVFAAALDGEKIPLTVVARKGIELDGSHPVMAYGYGAYGHGLEAEFDSALFTLVDHGFVYVTVHVRGGDDRGFGWYLNGKLRQKPNSFHDFIAGCEHLIAEGYTSAGRIAINGGSAGGLLVTAVVNMRPELFGCVVADVPFVDVLNTISDPSLPLTPPEWEEWGNPIKSKEDFDTILGYSPYDNVGAKAYPPMLYNAGISDEQVTYWEPLKMVAKLRSLKTDSNVLLLHMKMHTGHAGASKRYEWLTDLAFDYAFVLGCLRPES